MRAQRSEHEALISWLKFFDVEYIDASIADRLSALDINDQTQKEEAIHEIMGGLLMQGQANFYAIVRFPKLHKAMGRFVIGNRLYKTPAKVVLED